MSFRDKPTLGRLNKELYKLKGRYNFNTIFNDDCIDIVIKTIISNKFVIIQIRIPDNYPFKCPTIFLNGVNYFKILEEVSIKHKMTEMCLCCETVMCPYSWKPGIKIDDILNEILKYSADIMCLLAVDEYD